MMYNIVRRYLNAHEYEHLEVYELICVHCDGFIFHHQLEPGQK